MLSINIPVYNTIIDRLVLSLHKQAEKLNIPFEIRIYDDGSSEQIKLHNRGLKELSNVEYVELKENVGRAVIRNKMGFDSNFEWLLFIDSDSEIVQEDYLEKYLKIREHNRISCGGTIYSTEQPLSDKKLLRWKYGTAREAISAEIRNKQKGFIITSNNFIIEKKVFVGTHFRDEIKGYGHEDTLFGFDLYKNGVEILHVDNPVMHTGLEDASSFLEKSKSALKNLFFILENMNHEKDEFSCKVRFLDSYNKIIRFINPAILRLFYKIFGLSIEKNLKGRNPSLFWFDVYKLTYYSSIKKP